MNTDGMDDQPPSPSPQSPTGPTTGAGLERLEVWIFDLDNTLYPATANLFPQIDVRMKQFIAEHLGLPEDEAFILQKRYYHEYGTTLRGLMLRHGLEPDRFLDFVHAIDHSVLAPDPALAAALAALPGRRMVFTNGSEGHAVKVLDRLGLSGHFEAIFDIRAADYVPKPNRETYERLIRRHAVVAEHAAMFEDIHQNLVPAAALGMTTVWVRPLLAESPPPWFTGHDAGDKDLAHCHHVTDDLTSWLTDVVGRRTRS